LSRALLWRCAGCHDHQEHRRCSPFLASSSAAGSSYNSNNSSNSVWERERKRRPHPRVCVVRQQ
jgi:hypothetical protein